MLLALSLNQLILRAATGGFVKCSIIKEKAILNIWISKNWKNQMVREKNSKKMKKWYYCKSAQNWKYSFFLEEQMLFDDAWRVLQMQIAY